MDANKQKPKYLALYFKMGHYNEDDDVSPDLVGNDCPFEDSLELRAVDEQELERKIKEVNSGSEGADFEGYDPDVICDLEGNIQIELYRKLCSEPDFNPDKALYSHGRENLTTFWKREKWRWIIE